MAHVSVVQTDNFFGANFCAVATKTFGNFSSCNVNLKIKLLKKLESFANLLKPQNCQKNKKRNPDQNFRKTNQMEHNIVIPK